MPCIAGSAPWAAMAGPIVNHASATASMQETLRRVIAYLFVSIAARRLRGSTPAECLARFVSILAPTIGDRGAGVDARGYPNWRLGRDHGVPSWRARRDLGSHRGNAKAPSPLVGGRVGVRGPGARGIARPSPGGQLPMLRHAIRPPSPISPCLVTPAEAGIRRLRSLSLFAAGKTVDQGRFESLRGMDGFALGPAQGAPWVCPGRMACTGFSVCGVPAGAQS